VLADKETSEEVNLSIVDRLLRVNYAQTRSRPDHLPVLEICSENTGAGKSQLIYYIIAMAILPDIHSATMLDGKNSAVILLNTEAHFDVERLVQIMTSLIESKASETPITNIQDLIERSLQHLHIFQPRSMSAMLDTLSSLQVYLFDLSAHFSSQRAIHSIIIDSASAFYWETRAALENERVATLDATAPGASTSAMARPSPNSYALLVNRLRSLQQTFNCAVIAATTAFTYKDAATGDRTIRTLPAPWASFPTAKLLLKREEVRKFAIGISWEDALKDRRLRQAAVEQGHFTATALSSGSEGFRFAVTKEGVRIIHETHEEGCME
jgi:hypothetical protein